MHPVFKKINKFVNGQLCEFFYIDDKEVSSNVYYNLLENDFCSKDCSERKSEIKSDDKCCQNEKDFDTWVKNNIQYLRNVSDAEAFEMLKYSFNYYYKYGYYLGQIAINEKYIEDMKRNLINAKGSLEELITKKV